MTDDDRPIACTLGSEDLSDRRRTWEALSAQITATDRIAGGFAVRYRATEEVVQRLPALAEAEAECCGFAGWSVRRESDDVVLEVSGPEAALAALREEFAVDR